ncbi:transposase [Stenotrophomonas acidaminiphila]|uniref:transposase n=1 Tax=Stenotrophomonas acidaminiphila TaxID=128780 RepID=UPI003CCDD967
MAQANFGKIREILIKEMDLSPLRGTIHMDAVYLGGKPRKANHRKRKLPPDALKVRFGRKPPDNPNAPWVSAGMTRRNWEKRLNKRAVISLCEAGDPGGGSRRTIAFVCAAEDDASVMALATHLIGSGSIVMTDECAAYSRMSSLHEHYTVRHSREWVTHEGVNNNMSETWNSRVRRYEYGVGHGFRPKYIQDYVCEFSWRESTRRHSQQERIHDLLNRLLSSPPSAWWRGYWQGRHRSGEIGLSYFLDRLTKYQHVF